MDQENLPPGDWPRQGAWTLEHWELLPYGEIRYEVIDGVLYASTLPSTIHQWTSGGLIHRVGDHVAEHAPPPGILLSTTSVILPTGPVIPDLLYFHMRNVHILTEKWIAGVPDLLIEIGESETVGYDRREKQDAYAQSGVPEYWWVYPSSRTVEVLVLETTGKYRPLGLVAGRQRIPSIQLPNLEFAVEEIFMPSDVQTELFQE